MSTKNAGFGASGPRGDPLRGPQGGERTAAPRPAGPDQLAQALIRAARSGQSADLLLPEANKLAAAYPNHLGVLQALVEVHTALGQIDQALHHVDRMVALAPTQPMTHILHSGVLVKKYRHADAVASLERAERLAGRSIEVLSLLARHYESVDRHKDALRILQRMAEFEPDNGMHQQRIAAVLRFLGDLEGAEQHCDQSIASNPGDLYVYYLRSGLRKQTPDRNHVAELEALIAKGIADHRGRVHVQYALSKEYEDLGQADNAFRHLQEVSMIQRKEMNYDVKVDLATMDEIKTHFNRQYFERAKPGHPVSDPIFIVGMPRTGTTLVERILGSHSKVRSLGELGVFGRLMVRGVKELHGAPNVPPSERVKLTAQLDYRRIGEQYIEGVADRRQGEPHCIDKLPYNYLNVGPIHAAFPNAKIIQLDRHPMDTCFAIYKTLFGLAYPFSYTLEELGEYYAGYRRLMDHWHAALPAGRILRVSYEEVVADQESQTRRMLDHCGLPWEEQVREFYKSERASTTASAAQVRQPVYKSSIAKWRMYEKQLAPLRRVLEKHGIAGLD